MAHFGHLRKPPWIPTFAWYSTVPEVADRINSFHEDYPQRVDLTGRCLENLTVKSAGNGFYPVSNGRLRLIHQMVFGDTNFAGVFRTVRVRVGDHVPPSPDEVPELMEKLESRYLWSIESLDHLIDWYNDFQTIHPFQDGNGRVGGIIVAAYSHTMWPEMGWLGPNQ